jgi:hypothetical protein
MESFVLLVKNEEKEVLVMGILFAKFGPMLVKYLQYPLAMSIGSEVNLSSILKDNGKDDLLFLLFITSFKRFQVAFKSFFAYSNFFHSWL